MRTPDFCPGVLRLLPKGPVVTTHGAIGRPRRWPKTRSKKAAKAMKTGIGGQLSCSSRRTAASLFFAAP